MWQQFVNKLKSLIQPDMLYRKGRALYGQCVDQARLPQFYTDHEVEDAIGARFEMLTLHVTLVIQALRNVEKDDPRREQAHDMAQSLFDGFIEALDNTLREQGVGDLSVPKKMKKLGAVVYTRMSRWDTLWKEGNREAQADYLARTVYAATAYESEEPDSETLNADALKQALWMADYLQNARNSLDIDALLKGRIDWPAIAVTEAA
jgi:cytochrome b pre-mRNA-processing protein 3